MERKQLQAFFIEGMEQNQRAAASKEANVRVGILWEGNKRPNCWHSLDTMLFKVDNEYDPHARKKRSRGLVLDLLFKCKLNV
jgi:hypothetical protein